jgi:hypothetical protein
MPGAKEIIEEAECLPVEERIQGIASLLKTLDPPLAEIKAVMHHRRRPEYWKLGI